MKHSKNIFKKAVTFLMAITLFAGVFGTTASNYEVKTQAANYAYGGNSFKVDSGSTTYNKKKYYYRVVTCYPQSYSSAAAWSSSKVLEHKTALGVGASCGAKIGTTVLGLLFKPVSITLSVYDVLTSCGKNVSKSTTIKNLNATYYLDFKEDLVWVYVRGKNDSYYRLAQRGNAISQESDYIYRYYNNKTGKNETADYKEKRRYGCLEYNVTDAIKDYINNRSTNNVTSKIKVTGIPDKNGNAQVVSTENVRYYLEPSQLGLPPEYYEDK